MYKYLHLLYLHLRLRNRHRSCYHGACLVVRACLRIQVYGALLWRTAATHAQQHDYHGGGAKYYDWGKAIQSSSMRSFARWFVQRTNTIIRVQVYILYRMRLFGRSNGLLQIGLLRLRYRAKGIRTTSSSTAIIDWFEFCSMNLFNPQRMGGGVGAGEYKRSCRRHEIRRINTIELAATYHARYICLIVNN